MADIIRIILKSASGYGPAERAYTDRLVLTADSIGYEYKPYLIGTSETNTYRKWSYKTTSPLFAELFRQAADKTPYFLHNDEVLFATDITPRRLQRHLMPSIGRPQIIFARASFSPIIFGLSGRWCPGLSVCREF